MQRITITIEDDLLGEIDKIVEGRGYNSRSEAVRDMVRDHIAHRKITELSEISCYATLTYIYEHHVRDLPNRLADIGHHHQGLAISTLHLHITHESCLEVVVLRGTVSQVRAYADEVTTQRGVTQGRLHIMAAESILHAH
ncbi:nickel-responsive transcriptional regulator NikR [Methylobacterium oryzihabitans]|uniref:Putative nickel-responsive regulator n=1 Tax=Methylobacterium oryzihabitans TaxID=2499852 RepID=A0A3S2YT27_9HYPH|nr:nickel-responsive transcriptional regulator NikR [Methylobacterium oryzihabitans]